MSLLPIITLAPISLSALDLRAGPEGTGWWCVEGFLFVCLVFCLFFLSDESGVATEAALHPLQGVCVYVCACTRVCMYMCMCRRGRVLLVPVGLLYSFVWGQPEDNRGYTGEVDRGCVVERRWTSTATPKVTSLSGPVPATFNCKPFFFLAEKFQ